MQTTSVIYGGEIIRVVGRARLQEFSHQCGLAGVATSGYHNGVPLPAHCAGMDKQPIFRVCSNMQIQIGFEMVEKILNVFRSTQSRVVTIEHAEMPHIAPADEGRHYR